jgi:hypothetical protein
VLTKESDSVDDADTLEVALVTDIWAVAESEEDAEDATDDACFTSYIVILLSNTSFHV